MTKQQLIDELNKRFEEKFYEARDQEDMVQALSLISVSEGILVALRIIQENEIQGETK